MANCDWPNRYFDSRPADNEAKIRFLLANNFPFRQSSETRDAVADLCLLILNEGKDKLHARSLADRRICRDL